MKLHLFRNDSTKQAGFSHLIGMALMVLVFASIGVIGYKLYAHPRDDGQATSSGQSRQPDELDASAAPQIKKSSDLDAANDVLNRINTASASDNDTARLDSQLSSF